MLVSWWRFGVAVRVRIRQAFAIMRLKIVPTSRVICFHLPSIRHPHSQITIKILSWNINGLSAIVHYHSQLIYPVVFIAAAEINQ
jgi:hypothetical protein